ncbi:MAG: FecCD family ABC transporter permease [Nocardioides sp.]
MSTVEVNTIEVIVASRRRRRLRRWALLVLLTTLVVIAFAVSLMVGHTFYSLSEVWRVLSGETVPGASFTVGDLRLPRATMGLVSGAAFGMAGVTFQTMLRNPLASPDIIGISSGASAAAVIAIVMFSLTEAQTSMLAVTAALATAALIYLLSFQDGVVGARLILIGIGIAAMLDSVVSYVILRASAWDLQTAMRWLTGSLNGATWSGVVPVVVAAAIAVPVLLSQSRNLEMLRLGDDVASALGVGVERTRIVVIVAAVALIAFATAASGPIAFVAFLSGPIAARVFGPGDSLLMPAALVGALLVLVADVSGQWAFGTRYPVGVVTGALGAPYLVYLLIRTNRTGGSL